MDILITKEYEKQLKELLTLLAQDNYSATKHFKMYLDTIIINMQSKLKKYKKSIYFDDEDIKDIEFQGCRVPFYIDKKNNAIILLGITSKI